MTIGSYLEVYTKEYLLELALAEADPEMDKRQGSPLYDTLSIFCAKMADVFMEVKQIVEQAYIIDATKEENIDYRAAERGIYREQATQAQRLGVFTYDDGTPATVPIGALFSTIDENKANIVNYKVVGNYVVDDVIVPGNYVLECETLGTVGNTYYGEILPLTEMDTLGSATLTTVLTPARDKETNESVKERYFATFNIEAFGGNLADYKQYMKEFDGVGQNQIYPRTSKEDKDIVISCVDPSNQPISEEYQHTIEQVIDPENFYNNGNNTKGLGLGTAPIGHYVTITAPQETILDIDVTVIKTNTGYLPTIEANIKANLERYIKQLQDQWDDGDGEYKLVVYYNQILTACNTAEGVQNTATCLMNNDVVDIELIQSKEVQYIPKLGTVTVSVVE